MSESIDPTGPNAEQIEYWNGASGEKWVDFNPLLDRMLRPLGLQGMVRAAPAPGERVLDIGCGCGDTTLELARRVAPGGSATGVDISAPMLAVARRRMEEFAATATVVNADAETHDFSASGAAFDLVFSRFGVMFFADPEAAFANLHGALRPGGRITFVCWRAREMNPWLSIPFEAAIPHLPPFEPPAPEDPGPFAFADGARVERILAAAGFTDARLEEHLSTLRLGQGDLDACVAMVLKLGPVSRLLGEAGEAAIPPVAAAVREAVAPYHTGGALEMASAAWIVSARRG